MTEKIKRMVFPIRSFLLALILALFTLSAENVSADTVYQDEHNQTAEQEGVLFAASPGQQPERQNQDAKPEKTKKDTRAHSMMGFGGAGTNWMWACMIIVLMVVMMA